MLSSRSALVMSVAFLVAACAHTRSSSSARTAVAMASFTDGYDPQAVEGVRRLRAATQSFHSLDSAVAAGYPREVEACIVHEQHGAMGYHHLNRAYVDGTLVPEHPQFL